MPTITPSLRERIRTEFPSLSTGTVYLENAGGSQVPRTVADAIRDYMLTSYVQLGAGYPPSDVATATVDHAHAFVKRLVNGEHGHVFLGSSTSVLLRMIADCYAAAPGERREIVVAETGHEANVGPWTRLADAGFEIRWWRMDRERASCRREDLLPLLSSRTALVTFPHVSNLVGHIEDVAGITAAVHDAGARVVVDGVAYAPHRAIDVHAWNVDWYVYSTYKVYGPHMAALYGRDDAVRELRGPNHFFIPDDELPYKFELGGPSHEGCAGILALAGYLELLASLAEGGEVRAPAGDGTNARGHRDTTRETITTAFDLMTACELEPQAMLVDYLAAKRGVHLVGPRASDASRVSTISFRHESRSSREIAADVNAAGFGIRNGNMYAYHLCKALGIDPEDGVVRVSAVHYNTPAEIQALIERLEQVL